MTKPLFQRIAVLMLLFAAILAFVLGRAIAPSIAALSDEFSTLLSLLGYLIGTLIALVVWAILIWPLRRKAGFPTFSEELSTVRNGSLADSIIQERKALDERRKSNDPSLRANYYKRIALAGFGVSGLATLLTFVFFADGFFPIGIGSVAFVCLALSVYYSVQYVRWSRR